MKYREVIVKLKKLGCSEFSPSGKGSHRKWYNPETERGTVIPDWGSKYLKIGTVRAIVRQLGIEWDRFQDA